MLSIINKITVSGNINSVNSMNQITSFKIYCALSLRQEFLLFLIVGVLFLFSYSWNGGHKSGFYLEKVEISRWVHSCTSSLCVVLLLWLLLFVVIIFQTNTHSTASLALVQTKHDIVRNHSCKGATNKLLILRWQKTKLTVLSCWLPFLP